MDKRIYESPIPDDCQRKIAEAFWSPQPVGRDGYQAFGTSPYFQYYLDQATAVTRVYRGRLPMKTHQDVADIVEDMLKGDERPVVRRRLADRLALTTPIDDDTAELLDGSLDLSVRLLTMLDVGTFPRTYTGREPLFWEKGSLRDFLKSTFEQITDLSRDNVHLDAAFTARNMDLIAGMQVELTPNLADHLRFQEDGNERTIMIFCHASFLKNQAGSLFPQGFIDETIRTLALLFPPRDSGTKRWYKKQVEEGILDEAVLECGQVHRNLSGYKYWHGRLLELKRRFDEPRRASLKGLWNDRREGLAWTTLWVAIGCTVFFGLVQSVEGALQVYKAFNSDKSR